MGLVVTPDAKAPAAADAPETPAASAERRQLTVMFCDLVGSTALSARLDPEDLREIISAYHRRCAEVIVKHGGFVARYMGDGVLAYFGYPHAHEDDAERAVRAGLALVGSGAKPDFGSGPTLQMRIGIATGLVVVGDLVPDDRAHEYEVVGGTPNLAARLQALAEPDRVVIDSSTRRLPGKLFECRALGPVSVKGFGDPLPIWEVIGASAVHNRFEALRTATTPLVGRSEEIELLLRRWDQAKRGDGCVVPISGEPGIGKSRIAQTILERLSAEPHTRVRYFCSPHHQDSALYPSIAQLERAAGFRREDTADQRLDKLEAVLAQGTDLNDVVPLLADLLSIPTGDRYPALNLTPEKRKEKTLQAQLAHVAALAARRPVLMVYEDVHWCDPTTRELLDLLIDRVPTLRALVILTFRPEFVPSWVGRSHVTMIILNRLPPRQRAEMIACLTSGKALPKEIADQIVDRTDGVPLFIEELTKVVVESGVVVDAGDRYNASLLARLDRLASARDVAQIAGALGRSFSHELISAIASMPQEKLDDALAQLVDAELIFRRGTPPDAEYTFKHALVQDAAYSTLLRGRRQQLHARIAAALESQFPEIVATQPQLIAQHFAEAGLNEKAVGYWLKAGQQAVARSAMTEAVVQLQKGLDLLAPLADSLWRRQQELDLLLALGRALIAAKGYTALTVGETYARAERLAQQLDRSDYLGSLLYGQWVFHLVRSELRLALSLAERIEQIGERQDDVVIPWLGHLAHGLTRFHLGELVAARALLERCHGLDGPARRAFYPAVTAPDPYAMMSSWLAETLTYLGYIDQGRLRISEALTDARRLGHAYTLGFVLLRAANVQSAAGSPHQAERHAEEMVAVANQHGFPFWLAWGNAQCGRALTALGQAQDGLTLIAEGV
jgi:class 3 adenylate cyclase